MSEMPAADLGYDAGRQDGKTDGLVEAMRRLSAAGLHDARCPEPNRSCTCGIDAAIQQPPAGMAPVPLEGFAASPWGIAEQEFRNRRSDDRYGWHADGDLCLGSECMNVDEATGDHSTDVHSDEWWEGFTEHARRSGAVTVTVNARPEATRQP